MKSDTRISCYMMFACFQVAEMQVVLPSVQDELQTQKEKNSDLVKAHEQKESDLGEKVSDMLFQACCSVCGL